MQPDDTRGATHCERSLVPWRRLIHRAGWRYMRRAEELVTRRARQQRQVGLALIIPGGGVHNQAQLQAFCARRFLVRPR